MNQNSNADKSILSKESEMIDFVDIFMQLWKRKVMIIASMIIAVLLAIVYLFVAKEKWTSTAIISQPDAAQVASYSNALNVIYGPTSPKLNEIQLSVFSRFSSSLSALSETLDNQANSEKLAIDPTVKGQPMPLQISYAGDSAKNAQTQLAKYIQYVDEQIGEELSIDLTANIKLQISMLEDSLKTQEVVAQEQKELRITQISEALKFANEAKVNSPQLQQTSDVTQDTMVLLGSDALSSMIKNEATRPLVFSSAYYHTKQTLLDIQNLKIDPKAIHGYRYVMKPTLPIRRDSPKRGLTLVLAALLGGIVGAGVVLGRNALRSYKPVV